MVKTTADEKHEVITKKLSEMVDDITEINGLIDEMVSPSTWGSKDFNDHFMNQVFELQENLSSYKNYIRKFLR